LSDKLFLASLNDVSQIKKHGIFDDIRHHLIILTKSIKKTKNIFKKRG